MNHLRSTLCVVAMIAAWAAGVFGVARAQGTFDFTNARNHNAGVARPLAFCGSPVGTNHLVQILARDPAAGTFREVSRGGIPFKGTHGLQAPFEGYFNGGVLEVPFLPPGSPVDFMLVVVEAGQDPDGSRAVRFRFQAGPLGGARSEDLPPDLPLRIDTFVPGDSCPCIPVTAGTRVDFPAGGVVREGEVLPVVLHNEAISPDFVGFFGAGAVLETWSGPEKPVPVTNLAKGSWTIQPQPGPAPQPTGYRSRAGAYGDDVIVVYSVGLDCKAGGIFRTVPVRILPDARRPFLVWSRSSPSAPPGLILRGLAGQHHVIEASVDLGSWKTYAEFDGSFGEIAVPIPTSDAEAARFFRIR